MAGYSKMEGSSFDLQKMMRSSPPLYGVMLRMFAAIMDSSFGWPIHWYVAKNQLEPIEYADISEEPTFYPCQPFPAVSFPSDDVNDIVFQRQFLVDSSVSSPHYRSIIEYHKAYMVGEITPEIVVESVKAKIEESELQKPPLRCFTQLNWDLARQAASESTLRYKNGTSLSVLDGVPVGIKDELDVKEFRRNCGRLVEEEVNENDCDIVAALRSLGVVIIGITNMHEMGMGVTGINPHRGTARNPQNDKHITGGSSSGSAAAVSSGILPFALGSDGGGSVRIPSSHCGVQGIKPTFGRLSAMDTAFASSSVTSAGVIANNVADVALVQSLLSSKAADPRFFSPGCYNPIRCFTDKPFSEIIFGTNTEYVSYCNAETKSIFETKILPRLADVIEVEFEELYLSKIAHMNLILAETAQDLKCWQKHRYTLAPQTRMVFTLCRRLKLRHYMQSSCQKTRAINMFKSLFERVDVLITPTTACLPKEIDLRALASGEFDEENVLWTMWFVYMANLCGLPAMTFNAGYSDTGLPVGVMVVAPWWREDVLFTVAKQLETPLQKPARFYSTL